MHASVPPVLSGHYSDTVNLTLISDDLFTSNKLELLLGTVHPELCTLMAEFGSQSILEK